MDAYGHIPEFFPNLLASQYAAEDVKRVLEGCAGGRATTLRANTLKTDCGRVAQALDEAGLSWRGVPWYRDAFIIGDDASLHDLRALSIYEQGGIYLQSLSSMLPPLALGAHEGEDMLDMCAAPGGKTSQIAALSQGGARITACEMHASRAEKLEYNLCKLGVSNATVMRTDARRLDDFFAFDRILVDAPCSGSGTIDATDPRVGKRFTRELIKKTRKSQQALLDKALRLLKPGGTLVYSTCSVLACENEDIVEGALGRAARTGAYKLSPIAFNGLDAIPQLPTRLEGTIGVCPTDEYEGFFMARIIRSA